MYEDLKEKAIIEIKKKKAKRHSVYTVGVIFIAVSIILITISQIIPGTARFYLKIPILVLALVYAIIYFSAFGFPFLGNSDEISDEEIEREMVKIYKLQGSSRRSDENIDQLELKEIESLKQRWEDEDDFV